MTDSYFCNNNSNQVQNDMQVRRNNDNIFSNKADPYRSYRSESNKFRTPKKISNNSNRRIINNMKTVNKVNLGEHIESEYPCATPKRYNNQNNSMNNTRYRNTTGNMRELINAR